MTRTGPGRWGRACGSVDYVEDGTPPGGQSGLGSTWLPVIENDRTDAVTLSSVPPRESFPGSLLLLKL